MSNVTSQFSPAAFSGRQNALSDAQFSSYIRQKSVTAEERLEAGLTITTKEGDLVTLTSNSYAKLDAYSYNSKGVVHTEDGKAIVKENQREVTLSSGESFSFSVVGDLNEEELEDIEAIVKDIDDIIEEMAEGDMDDAVSIALGMGGYDSVSEFSADISYERSYSRTVETQAVRGEIPAPEAEATDLIEKSNVLPQPEKPIQPVEPWPENSRPWRSKSHSVQKINNFMEKMAERFGEIDDDQVLQSKQPIEKLFNHHVEKAERQNEDRYNSANFLKEARKQVEDILEQLTSRIFDRQLSSLVDDDD